MHRILIQSASGPYSVLAGRRLLPCAADFLARLGDFSSIFVLTSPRVHRHWGRVLLYAFPRRTRVHPILFDDRESAKNLSTVESISRRLVCAGADRHSLLIALGGGVVGDVAGFVAATYFRGVALVHVPTTLLAQIDSSIGGKTGVNLPEGKNLIGAFYPPRLVIADTNTLRTLPAREYRSGLYELIKYSVIGPRPSFSLLERRLDALLRRNPAAIAQIIPQAIAAKAAIVSKDERESGPRQILNFGHTFAHAFEVATNYRRFLHGEAVAWGMFAATWLATALGRIPPRDALRIVNLIARVGPLPRLPQLSPARLISLMRTDKKSRAGRLTFVLPRRIASAEISSDIPVFTVKKVLNSMLKSGATS